MKPMCCHLCGRVNANRIDTVVVCPAHEQRGPGAGARQHAPPQATHGPAARLRCQRVPDRHLNRTDLEKLAATVPGDLMDEVAAGVWFFNLG